MESSSQLELGLPRKRRVLLEESQEGKVVLSTISLRGVELMIGYTEPQEFGPPLFLVPPVPGFWEFSWDYGVTWERLEWKPNEVAEFQSPPTHWRGLAGPWPEEYNYLLPPAKGSRRVLIND